MNLGEFLATVKKHWKTFVITAAAVLAVGLIWLALTPGEYVSTTRLLVSVEGTTTATAYENDNVVAGRVNTYAALLTSDVVNQRVVDKLRLHESPRELASNVSATIVPPRTALIDVAVTAESAEQAQLIAQTLAEEFIKFADAMETPTGEDDQKVHTTIVTAATAPHEQLAQRVALGGLAALAALVLGAAAVWIRSARNPVLRLAKQDTTAAGMLAAPSHPAYPPTETAAPAPPKIIEAIDPV
jgi:capsular polysaccharide biosynthesis protein